MNRPARPVRQVCPLCSRDDSIKVEPIGPGLWRHTCGNQRHPDGTFSWQSTVTDRVDEHVVEGKAADLGLYEDLPRCLVPGEPFVQYGAVEYRYSELRPSVYEQLIRDYSHTRIERNKPYTALVFIASALGRLAEHGELLYRFGPATGHWSCNEVVSYWALPPGPEELEATQLWVDFASKTGLHPFG